MSNHVPLQEAVAAAGGYAVPTEKGALLETGIFQKSGFLAQAQAAGAVTLTQSNAVSHVVYKGRPTAYFVDEDAAIPTTGAELGTTTVNVKDIGTIVRVTRQMIADCPDYNALWNLVSKGVDSGIADLVDKHALGLNNGANLTSSFDFDARADATGTVVNLGATGDKERVAVSHAIANITNAGYNPTGVIWTPDALASVRDARQSVENTNEVYAGSNPFYGLNTTYSTNLNTFSAGLSKVIGVVADFSQIQVVVRQGLELATSTDATVDGNNVFERNGVAFRWTTRVGINTHAPDAIVLIKTAAS